MKLIFELFSVFFMIGLFTFGGGYAMIPLLQQEVVGHGWVDEATVIDFIAVSESTPGPFAVNMATFVGFRMAGVAGCIAAVLGIVLPSFLVILIIAKFFIGFADNRFVKNILLYLRPVVLGLIGYATVNVFMKTAFSYGNGAASLDVWALVMIGLIFLISRKFRKIHPIFLIMLSALLGIVIYGFVI